jgi:protein-S-isoprenylcysteine O-methyltransferase Ste14
MALTDEMGLQGSWLFRWRSYVPFVLLALMLPPSLVGLGWPFGSYQFHKVWESVCVLISLSGFGIRCATVGFVPRGTSGRGTAKLNATVLNTTGMYSLVRHPLYLGNYLIGLGVTLVWLDWWAPVIYSLCFGLYYERIMIAEEQYLARQFGDAFRQWASVTPSIVPSPSQFRHWQRPALPFSFRSMLRREYSTFALLIALHAGMEAIENYWIEGRLGFGLEWGGVLIGVVAIYVLLRLLKKRTKLLKPPGR